MAEASERAPGNPWLHVRREPFDFGLLPIPAIASYKEASTETLKLLRQRLIDASLNSEGASTTSPTRDGSQEPRVTCEAIESCLKLSKDQARLVLDTLASVLPTGSEDIDSLSYASPSDAAKIGTDVDLLLLFLFLQRYRRVPNRSSRDAAVLADVWPQGPSPFDSVSPTATSALQIKTSLATRQRFQTGHAEEEQQQLSFLQKNLPAVLQLLAEHGSDAAGSGDGTEPGTQVISIDKFELLGLFLRVNRPGVASLLLSQVAPFFAEADAAMPPAPVPLSVAQDWLGPRLCCTSDHGPDLRPQSPSRPAKVPADRGGDTAASPTKSGDTPMGEGGAVAGSGAGAGAEVQGSPRGAAANGAMTGGVLSRRVWVAAGMTTVDGVAKMSVLKGETEVDSSCVRVAHCHDSVIYVLAPLKYASVIGCSDSIVVLGAVGKVVRVEACERLTLIAPCARIRIANCRECVFYLGCNSRPVILGDNHSLQIAPYNTFYPRLDYHLAKVGVDPAVNKWDLPLALGSLDAAAAAGAAGAGTAAGGVSGAGGSAGAGGGAGGAEGEGAKEGAAAAAALDSAILMPPEKFVPFVVPFRTQQEQPGGGGGASPLLQQATRANPFALPKTYLIALQHKTKTVESLRQTLKTAVLDEGRKRELTNNLSSKASFSTTKASCFVKQVSAKTVCSAEKKEENVTEQAGKIASALALAAIVSTGALAVPEVALADVAGLTPCKDSKAFAKRQKNSIKKLKNRLKLYKDGSAPALALNATIERTERRFSFYGKSGLLCGTDGLPHLIVDGDFRHAGEFVSPGIVFLYIAGWIGWVGRSYLIKTKEGAKPTEKEIIIDVPLALSLLGRGATWPVAAWSEYRKGDLIVPADQITVSPR
ncbi:unnamed protein product [Closterium sp. Naga37s-1]|nr:unnamed protein product [Closterium sp. Naga37s-1]